jgi:hypothetical protein
VLASKRSRLVDLIRMAEFDLEHALTVARQREFSLSSPFGGPGDVVGKAHLMKEAPV